jgi:uncharacterized protein (DUF2062 family)
MNHAAKDRAGFWQRRILGPVVAQLTQGISAGRISLTISIGVTLGIFPILGATAILGGITAWMLKLNQPILHGIASLVFPLKCLLLLPFYRAGEALFGVPSIPLSIPLIISRFFEDTGKFFQDYGMTGVRGIVVWGLIAPVIGLLLYYALHPPLRAMARRLKPTTL